MFDLHNSSKIRMNISYRPTSYFDLRCYSTRWPIYFDDIPKAVLDMHGGGAAVDTQFKGYETNAARSYEKDT